MRIVNGLILFLVLVCVGKTQACSCIGQRTVEQELKHADAVVTGKVISTSIVLLFDSLWIHDFNVDSAFAKITLTRNVILINKLYKGKITGDTLIIYTGVGGGDCGIKFRVGEQYIVYGEKESYLSNKDAGIVYPKEKNSYWTYVCMRTGLFDKLEIDEIEKLVSPKTKKQNKSNKYPKSTKAKIVRQVALIDSLRFEKAFRLMEFKSKSGCATNVSAYFAKDSLKYIYSFNSVNFYSSITHVYFKNNELMKVVFYEQKPELEMYFKKYNKETDKFANLTYHDKTIVYYISSPLEMYELIKGKEIKCKTDQLKYKEVLSCIKTLVEESK